MSQPVQSQVLINKDSGLAEQFDPAGAQQALAAGTHEVPIVDPTGQVGSASLEDASNLVNTQGYRQPTSDQLGDLMSYAQHSGPLEQAKTFGEGAASALTLGASTFAERAMGANPDDINARREVNPGANFAGQTAGLLAGMYFGTGEARTLQLAGQGAEATLFGKSALGMTQEALSNMGAVERMARAGTRMATEGALMGFGDEASKMFASDPDQTVQSAVANIGLSAALSPVLGAGLEGISKLWNAGPGEVVGKWLGAAKQKLAIEAGELPAAVGKDVAEKYPEIASVVSDYPGAKELHQDMLNSPGVQGDKYRAQIKDFVQDQSNSALEGLGYTPEDLKTMSEISPDERGQKIIDTISKDIGDQYKPFKENFDALEEKYKNMPLDATDKGNLSSAIGQIAQGFSEVPDSAQAKALQDLMGSVEGLKTVDGVRQLKKMASQSLDGMWDIMRPTMKAIDDSKASVVLRALGEEEGPAALKMHSDLNEAYGGLKDQIYELNKRLHVKGGNEGPGIFINGLQDMNPQTVLNRLNPKADAGLIDELGKIPGVADVVKEHNLDQMIRGATNKDQFNLPKFTEAADKLTPEMRSFLMGDEAYQNIKQTAQMVKSLPTTINPSGTARAGMGMFSKFIKHLTAAALTISGHPAWGFGVEAMGNLFTRELPDAVKMAYMRFLSNPKLPVNPAAFKSVVQLADASIRGSNAIKNGVRTALSSQGKFVVPLLTDNETKRLEAASKMYQEDPTKFINMNGDLGHYEPNHADANTQMTIRAMEMMKMIAPRQATGGILDRAPPIGKVQQSQYKNHLQIIAKPLTVIQKIGNGTLTSGELNTFKTVYPQLHQAIADKAMSQLIDMKSKGVSVPYKKAMALSLFMGQPLESSMRPSAILSNQPQPQPQPSGPGGQPNPIIRPNRSMKALTNFGKSMSTPGQAAEARRATR